MYRRNLIDYLPQVVKNIKEYKAIMNDAEQPEIVVGWRNIDNIWYDQFIDSLTDNGCDRWEKMLKIQPKATDTVEIRRFRIKTKLNEDLPYTYNALVHMLNNLCGEGHYTIQIDNDKYKIKILIELTVKRMRDEVESTIKRIIPANLILEVDLRYNQHKTLAKYTYKQLSKYTHIELREEVLNG